jgi:phosphopantothenoylcysteine synthetase/decarboxylase
MGLRGPGSCHRAWCYDLDRAFAAPIEARCGLHAVQKPVVLAPAMNTVMWHQRTTADHVAALAGRPGVTMVEPVVKTLACGDTGQGAMAEVSQVAAAAVAAVRAHEAMEQAAAALGLEIFEQ